MAGSPLLSGFDSDSVGVDLVPITPHDDNDLPVMARAIRCKPNGAAGILRITTVSGNVRNTYIDVGEVLQVATSKVHDTGTDATGLEAIL